MSNTNQTAHASTEIQSQRVELRLIGHRAHVRFPELVCTPGVVITECALQLPQVTFSLNTTDGTSPYQKQMLDFAVLECTIDAEVLTRQVPRIEQKLQAFEDITLHFHSGCFELQARFWHEATPISCKVFFDGTGETLGVYFYEARLYSYSTMCASSIGAMLAESIQAAGLLPSMERRGASGFVTRVLPQLLKRAVVDRGYAMPRMDHAQLSDFSVTSSGLKLRFVGNGLPFSDIYDEKMSLVLEGSRAFSDAEDLLADGKLEEARASYLQLIDTQEPHSFAVERLLTLLLAEPQMYELALDVAQRWREKSSTALWVEGAIREYRGETAKAAECYLELCQYARKNQEEGGTQLAAEALMRLAGTQLPHLAIKALNELLDLKPEHLPSLRALAHLLEMTGDQLGVTSVYRRLAALSRDLVDAAHAHTKLARLSADVEDNLAGARLHCEAALRLKPDDVEALLQLGQFCYQSEEWLRALKVFDRVRAIAVSENERGRANILAGRVLETGLQQPEDALQRYREAASLLPNDTQPHYLSARVAESLGHIQEAALAYKQVIEIAGQVPEDPETQKTVVASHRRLARLFKNAPRAMKHLEAAWKIDPNDTESLHALLPHFRATENPVELAVACERVAAITADASRRAALLAEAGEVFLNKLNQVEQSERLFAQALEEDPKNRLALECTLQLAENRHDGAKMIRCLEALALLCKQSQERANYYRRLAVAARDLTLDFDMAAFAYREVARIEPNDLQALIELIAIQRRRGDALALAWALEQCANLSESLGDIPTATIALRELSEVFDMQLGRSNEALAALTKVTTLCRDATALYELGVLALRLERVEVARRALEEALSLLEIPEKRPEIHRQLGRACELLGDVSAAKEHHALALRTQTQHVENNRVHDLSQLSPVPAKPFSEGGQNDVAHVFFSKAAQNLQSADDAMTHPSTLDVSPSGTLATQLLETMAQFKSAHQKFSELSRLFAQRAALAETDREAAFWYFTAAHCVMQDEKRTLLPVNEAPRVDREGEFSPDVAVENNRENGTLPDESSRALQADSSLENSTETPMQLARLARETHQRKNDFEGAYRLYQRAAEISTAPLPIVQETVELLRATGKTAELANELHRLAILHVAADSIEAALVAWDEATRLAEDPLHMLTTAAKLCEKKGWIQHAAHLHLQCAKLQCDRPLDDDGSLDA